MDSMFQLGIVIHFVHIYMYNISCFMETFCHIGMLLLGFSYTRLSLWLILPILICMNQRLMILYHCVHQSSLQQAIPTSSSHQKISLTCVSTCTFFFKRRICKAIWSSRTLWDGLSQSSIFWKLYHRAIWS